MANEIEMTFGWRYSKNGNNFGKDPSAFNFNVGNTLYLGPTQDIGFAAHEALYVTGLSNGGFTVLYNNDATNYVQIGLDVGGTFYPLFDIPAQKPAILPRLSTLALYAKANTAAVNLSYFIFQQ